MGFFMSLIGAVFIAPLLAFAIATMQGIYFLVRYRIMFRHAPVPLLPAHGIVRKRGTFNSITSELPPVNLLVIGDSLAAGVGARSCTPVLPESIAKTISRHLNHRTVSWTCLAEPGAPAGWIVDKLERKSSILEKEKQVATDTTNIGGVPSSPISLEEGHGGLEDLPGRVLESDVLQDFDIGIVVTGLNDLKNSFLPFLLGGKQLEFHREAKARGSDYGLELKRAVLAVANKMKNGFKESMDRLKISIGCSPPRVPQTTGLCKRDATVDCSNSSPTDSSSSSLSILENERTPLVVHKQGEGDIEKNTGCTPLIVLPALPRTLPVLQYPPFIWFILPLLQHIDRTKRKIAETYQGSIVFVEPPSKEELHDYETRQFSEDTEPSDTENALVSITNISKSERRRIQKAMKEYYQEMNEYLPPCNDQNYKNSASCLRGSTKSSPPGESLLSADRIHWNDEGYEFWGKYIATAVIKEWEDK